MARTMPENRKRRPGLRWLKPVSSLVALYAKIRASRSSDKLKKKIAENLRNKRTVEKKGMVFREDGTIHGVEEEEQQQDKEDAVGLSGEGGIWQRSILMGGKCDPLNFSGVIYYDEKGRKLDKLPFRSPRSSPFPAYLSREQQDNEEEVGLSGDGGIWQRSILMGGKCDPLNFSGVIYYDEKGRKLDKLPLRSSPFPAHLSRAQA